MSEQISHRNHKISENNKTPGLKQTCTATKFVRFFLLLHLCFAVKCDWMRVYVKTSVRHRQGRNNSTVNIVRKAKVIKTPNTFKILEYLGSLTQKRFLRASY